MALQASGPISFSQISNEFGTPSGKNLGAYRISQTVGNLNRNGIDDGIPTSGQIKFSDFYSKSLNVVVYCSGNRINARSRYNDNNNVTVIGGYKTRPASSSGTKVWIHTNETIGSNIPASSAPNRQYCSLITGGWDDNTDLRLDIGTSGVVSGSGGKGGNGGGATWLNDALTDATPGLFGAVLTDGSSGTSGSQTVGGNGGAGGYADNSFAKCRGGAGGNHQSAGETGVIVEAENSSGYKSGAAEGASGFGIIITNDGTGVTISGNARVGGDAYSTAVS